MSIQKYNKSLTILIVRRNHARNKAALFRVQHYLKDGMEIAHSNPKSKINKHKCTLMQLSWRQERDVGWELHPWKEVGTVEQEIALAH